MDKSTLISGPTRMTPLNRSRSLSRAYEFARVREEGSSSVGRSFVVAAIPANDETTRLGVICTKKIGNAVTRNRVRRQAKEIFREFILPSITGKWHVVLIARWSAPKTDFAYLIKDICKNAARLNVIPSKPRPDAP